MRRGAGKRRRAVAQPVRPSSKQAGKPTKPKWLDTLQWVARLMLVAVLVFVPLWLLLGLVWSLMQQLPMHELLAGLITAAIVICAIAAGFTLAGYTPLPQRWLLMCVGGLVTFAAALTVLAAHGSFDARFQVPARGGEIWLTVATYGSVAIVFGVALLIWGFIGYLKARKKLKSGR